MKSVAHMIWTYVLQVINHWRNGHRVCKYFVLHPQTEISSLRLSKTVRRNLVFVCDKVDVNLQGQVESKTCPPVTERISSKESDVQGKKTSSVLDLRMDIALSDSMDRACARKNNQNLPHISIRQYSRIFHRIADSLHFYTEIIRAAIESAYGCALSIKV